MSIKIKPVVRELATAIKESLETDSKAGVISEKEGSIYISTLPEGITEDIVEAVSSHNTNFVAASSLAVGELALDGLAENKDIDRFTGHIDMIGKDSITINVDRSKSYPAIGSNEPIVKKGVVTTNYEIRAGKNAGQLKGARQHIAELANKAL